MSTNLPFGRALFARARAAALSKFVRMSSAGWLTVGNTAASGGTYPYQATYQFGLRSSELQGDARAKIESQHIDLPQSSSQPRDPRLQPLPQ